MTCIAFSLMFHVTCVGFFMQTIIYDYNPDFPGCGLLADLPDGSSLFFNSFEEFLAFFFAEFPDVQLVPLFREGEDEYC